MLCTHLHFDHVLGCGFVHRDYGLELEASMADSKLYDEMSGQLTGFLGLSNPDELLAEGALPPIGRGLDASCVISFGTHQLDVIETPGHTPGGLCFYCKDEHHLFCGDTLFYHSVGRTDLDGGNQQQLLQSISRNLYSLPGEVQVWPGHGRSTTIQDERMFNPYV